MKYLELFLLDHDKYVDLLYTAKRTSCSGLIKTALNNVVLPTLFNVVNSIVQYC